MDHTPQTKVYDEDSIQLDEAEEEALLKSDDELDGAKMNVSLNILRPPSSIAVEDNSMMNETNVVDNGIDPEDKSLDEEINKAGSRNIEIIEIDDDDDDGDDDDDDEEEDEEVKSLKEFHSILKELEQNQYAYDKYVRLCELSHKTGDLDNIRKAYSSFASVYPLTPELWQKYIGVEMNLAQFENEISQVKELFRRALNDYYSCDLALEYANFSRHCSDSDTIWQELLGTYGLNCFRGREFFKLHRLQFTSGIKDLSQPDNKSEYIKSYLMELRFPLYEMEETYIEFKVFYEKNMTMNCDMELDWNEIDSKYFKAKEHLQKILEFEEKLKALEANAYREKAELYFDYIKYSDKYLDENVLQTIYERMVADCCLNAECWLKYIDFIDYRDEFGRPEDLQRLPLFQQTPDNICQRALRNCTWSAELYVKRMHLMEKMNAPKSSVQEILESAAAAGFQTPEPAVIVWMEYLTYLRRNTDWSNLDECDILRKNFNMAWTILGQQWGVLADCNCEILQFWGRLEYGPLQDPKKGKELWTTVMESADNAGKSGLWIEFAQLEMRRDLDATRKLFSKALNAATLDNPYVIASAWERFERCNGTIKSLNNCLKDCKRFQLQFGNTSFTKHQKSNIKTSKRKISQNDVASDAQPIKQAKAAYEKPAQPLGRPPKEKESTFKEHENQEIDLSKDHLRIFLSNLDYNLGEQDIRDGLPEVSIVSIELIRSANGRSRGFGYVELANKCDVEKALKLDRKELNGRPVYISSVLRDKEQRQKFKYSADMEPTKLFVKGLPSDTTQAELEEIFKEFGTLKDVRLVYHKSGKFKNIAYVEYQQESSAGRAVLALDNMNLRGHTILVAISAPPSKPSVAPVNPIKLLGISAKRNRNQFEQKPRMSLVPMAVRKNLSSSKNATTKETLPVTTSSTSVVSKSNDDFRKLLNK